MQFLSQNKITKVLLFRMENKTVFGIIGSLTFVQFHQSLLIENKPVNMILMTFN